MVGGSGFYGKPTKRQLADCFAFGEEYLIENSPLYTDPRLIEIRKRADSGLDTTELRRKLALDTEEDPLVMVSDLVNIAAELPAGYQRDVRLDQARSLRIVAMIATNDLGVTRHKLNYKEALFAITGVEPLLIPTDVHVNQYRLQTFQQMGVTGSDTDSLAEAARRWREEVGFLSKSEMGIAYRDASQLVLEILKKHKLLPQSAELNVDILHHAPFMGFFAYGNKEGEVYGETCMVESDTKCVFDVINTALHEVGGHYLLHALWHKYARNTGDLYGAVGAMACNQAVVNEGYANTARKLFRDDLTHIFKNMRVGGLEKMSDKELETNLYISANLEYLSMMALGYMAARYFHARDITAEQMEQEYIALGVDPHRAKSRVEHMTQSKSMLKPFCYYGPSYFPGMAVVSDLADKLPALSVINLAGDSRGPPSLSTLDALRKDFSLST
ncbi:hypothetical protein C4573_03065 [Candidatus Woesearchaeota archaeon]|nr:MAG: hypothetical protein C4573_03065 [Candidatus Woesearchaeota archaeon]